MTPPAQLSTGLPTFSTESSTGWTHLIEFARVADEAGFDRLVMSDHVAFGENLDAYSDPAVGGSRGQRQPTGPDGAWLDPIVTIAHLTAVTSRIRFGTNILVAALRRPVVLAKMLSTIDVLSGGRLDIGVGVGWQREEYEAAGLEFERRGRLLDHTIEVCQTLWRVQTAEYTTDDLSFSRIHQMPKPIQPNGIPIWVSGSVNPRSMNRLARYGSGWIPWGDDAADIQGGISRMRAAVEERGRNPDEIGVVATLRMIKTDDGPDLVKTMAPVPELWAAGVTDFRVHLPVSRENVPSAAYLKTVVDAFRDTSG